MVTAKSKKKKQGKKKGNEEGGGSSLITLEERLVPHSGREEHAELRQQVIDSRSVIDRSRWSLAEALYIVRDQTIYERWGYYSWEEYVSSEVGMTVRTTQYLTAMYHCFYIEIGEKMSADEKKELVDKIGEIGWTKARALVGVVDIGNLDDWFERAKQLSSSDLESEAKRALLEKNGEDPEGVQTMKNVAFRVVEEQQEIIEQAIGLAKDVADSDKRGNLISLICQDFVATNMARASGSSSERMGRYLDRIGAILGIKIVAVDKDSGKVVHGGGTLKKIEK